MRRALIALIIVVGSFAMLAGSYSAGAGERPEMWRYTNRDQALPFPRSDRSQSVWASGACWSECGSYCAWGMASCLERNEQGKCITVADVCDRYCQRTCRPLLSSGPLVPYIDLPLLDYPIVK